MYVYIYMLCMYTVILDTSGHWIFSKHIPFGINALKLSVSLKLIHIFIWVSQPLPYPPHGGLFCQVVQASTTCDHNKHNPWLHVLYSYDPHCQSHPTSLSGEASSLVEEFAGQNGLDEKCVEVPAPRGHFEKWVLRNESIKTCVSY